MTITEIMNEIHKERVELEIFEALSQWMIDDRRDWTERAMDAEATVKAIGKIAKENSNKNDAIDGIINLCESSLEDEI